MEEHFQTPPPAPRRKSFLSGLRNSFLTGVVVIAPVGLTVWLIWSVIGWVDGVVLPFVPSRYQPENILNTFLGLDIQLQLRGLGVVLFLIFTTFVGWLAKGLLGRSLIRSAERFVNRMPVVRSIYSGVKQIAETVFSQADRSFEKACIVQYPRKGIWAVAPCRVGCDRAAQLMENPTWDTTLLEELATVMEDASICGLGQAAPNPIRCTIKYFPHEITSE